MARFIFYIFASLLAYGTNGLRMMQLACSSDADESGGESGSEIAQDGQAVVQVPEHLRLEELMEILRPLHLPRKEMFEILQEHYGQVIRNMIAQQAAQQWEDNPPWTAAPAA